MIIVEADTMDCAAHYGHVLILPVGLVKAVHAPIRRGCHRVQYLNSDGARNWRILGQSIAGTYGVSLRGLYALPSEQFADCGKEAVIARAHARSDAELAELG